MRRYVLDTSALLTLFGDESGAERVAKILGEPVGGMVHEVDDPPRDEVYLPFMALMEFDYIVQRRFGLYEADRARHVLRAWPAELVESYPQWGRRAALVKSKAGLSLADAWNAALALLLDAELVHKDPEFDEVEGLRSLRLPAQSR